MGKRALLAGAMLVGLACLTGDALAKSKKPKDPLEETAPPADKRPTEAANVQLAATTSTPAAAPAAAPVVAPVAGTVRVGIGVSATASPSDLAASCAKMISAAPDAATKNSLMQTCSQQLGGAPADPAAAPAAEPPRATPAAEPAATSAATPEPAPATSGRAFGKAGNFMMNFRLGYVPAFSLGAPTGTGGTGTAAFSYPPQGLLGAEFGFSIQSQRKLYLVFPLTFSFQGQTAMIMIPIGINYDIALPIKNLYVTPRISLGYTALVSTINLSSVGGGSSTVVGHAGLIAPEIGIKYVLRDRVNLGIDLLSVPIVFGPGLAIVSYRVAAYVGVNF